MMPSGHTSAARRPHRGAAVGRSLLFGAALGLAALSPPAAAAPPVGGALDAPTAPARTLGQPWSVLPWGDQGPGLTAGLEQRPVGPTAFAAGADGLWVADAAHEQLLSLGLDGSVRAAVTLGAAAEDVRLGADGRPFALLADLETVAETSLAGSTPTRAPAAARPVRQLSVGAGGEPWVVSITGLAAPLHGAASVEPRAAQLGAAQGTARLDGGRDGRVLLWGTRDAATEKAPGLRTIPVHADLPIGLIRPLAAHADGTVTVLLELLASESPLAIRAEVRRLDAAGEALDVVAFDVSGVAPANRYVDVAPDGSLWVMQSRADGLALWHLPWAAPAGGAR